ncbi:MAG: hypothetical protein JWR53_1302 [Glaciihabitans sp.]|jgi:hypothetical protein|nr:hypothetical protein [Glaciihabitans sp.]
MASVTPVIPELPQRSRVPATALLLIGGAAWVFLLILTGVHLAYRANVGFPRSGVGVLALLIVVLTILSFVIEVAAAVLGAILGVFAFRRRPVRAPVRTIVGLALIATSIIGSILVFVLSTLPPAYAVR